MSAPSTACAIVALLLLPVVPGCAGSGEGRPDAPADVAADAPADAAADVPPDLPSDVPPPACVPVEADPGTTPRGDPRDGWRWSRHGVVLDAWPGAAAMDGWIGPALAERDGTLHLFATRKEGLGHRIHHATSTDGVTFTVPEAVRGLGDGTVQAYPSVVRDGPGFRMWFAAGWIDAARSPNGRDWTVELRGALKAGPEGAFDAVGVLYPTVVPGPAGWDLWYTGFDGRGYAVGHGTSPDGLAWVRDPPGPVLQAGAPAGFDNRAVAQPCVLRAGARYRMWYGGYDTSRTDPGPWRIGLAESDDGRAWVKRGVSLDLLESGAEAWSTRDPAVVPRDGGWRMVYAALGDDARYRLFRATSDACAD